jgi:hypothetical protein
MKPCREPKDGSQCYEFCYYFSWIGALLVVRCVADTDCC